MTTSHLANRITSQLAGNRRLHWMAAFFLLLPPVFFLFPVPIDETRYLAVAWNMRWSGQWLVPWLDGAPYSDKAPLLFWLINLAWSVTGVHAWAVRLLELLIALATVPLLASLGRRLGASEDAVENAQWLWLGCAALAFYADVVMFDLLLTFCTLAAWRATPALVGRHWPGESLLMVLALGAGVLVKGPVALLVGGMPALFAPYWMPALRVQPLVFYLRLLGIMAVAILLVLAWAIPAARAGGPHYADAIFLHQTMGRVVHSFAHARPWWWYLPILPLMTLPWTLCLGRNATATTSSLRHPSAPDRFVAATFIPCFVVFSLISGKQPHYLLPLLPALALFAGGRLAAGRWRLSPWRAGVAPMALGLLVALGLGWWEAPGSGPWAWVCGGLIMLMGVLYPLRRTHALSSSTVALGMLTAIMLCKLAFVLSIGPRYDVHTMAQRIAAAQRAGTPLLYAGSEYGLFTFAGRLTAPIPSAHDPAQVAAWAHAHPDGWIISSNEVCRQPDSSPLYRQAYLGRSLGIWQAGAIDTQACNGNETAVPRRDPGHA